MSDYIDAQRRANEFNAQAPKDEIAELKRAVCVLAQAIQRCVEYCHSDFMANMSPFGFVEKLLDFNNGKWVEVKDCSGFPEIKEQLKNLIADLQPPPAGGRGE